MDLRLAVYELVAEHRLDPTAARRLERLAGWHEEPASLRHWLPRGVAVLAAALAGLGLIFWIAANWDTLGRAGRFTLLEGVVVLMCAAALWRPAARAPFGLLALLGIGGVFAYFGQTYQTGADPWQLFALWAVLGLPLGLALRSDVVWAPWALIATTAISLWVHAHVGHRWSFEPGDLRAHLLGWGSAFALVTALSPLLSRHTGAGVWAFRTALTLAVVMVTLSSLGGLFSDNIGVHYGLGLALLAAAALALAMPRSFEVYGLSAVAFGLDTLLVAGLARWVFDKYHGGEPIFELLLIGLVAAGLLAASVTGVLRLARRYALEGEAA